MIWPPPGEPTNGGPIYSRGKKFLSYSKCPYRLCSPSSPTFNAMTGFFPPGFKTTLKLTTYLRLVPRLQMRQAIYIGPPYPHSVYRTNVIFSFGSYVTFHQYFCRWSTWKINTRHFIISAITVKEKQLEV